MELSSLGSEPRPDEAGRERARLELEAARGAEREAADQLRNFSMLASLTAAGERGEFERLRQAADQASARRQAAEADCLRLGIDLTPPAGLDQAGPTSLAA